jgi:hypothetical protein
MMKTAWFTVAVMVALVSGLTTSSANEIALSTILGGHGTQVSQDSFWLLGAQGSEHYSGLDHNGNPVEVDWSRMTIIGEWTGTGTDPADLISFGVYNRITGQDYTMHSAGASHGDQHGFGHATGNPQSQFSLDIGFFGGSPTAVWPLGDFGASCVGFWIYDETTGKKWYSDSSLNSDGQDHMVAYTGYAGGTLSAYGPNGLPNPLETVGWGPNDVVLGWSSGKESTPDFNDFVIVIQGAEPCPLGVPDGGSMLVMLGLTLSGLAMLRRQMHRG